jgi:hypothetical protein
MKKLSVLLFLTSLVYFGCGQKTDDVQEVPQTQPPATQNETAVTAPQIGNIWKQVEMKNETLEKIIKEGKSEHIHEAEEIANILKVLPERSTGLEASKLGNVNRIIGEINSSAIKIDELSHARKTDDLKEEYQNFNKLLSDLKNQYPEESFK